MLLAVAVVGLVAGCQMVQSTVQNAATVAQAASGAVTGLGSEGTLQTILAAVLTGVRDIFEQRQRIDLWLLATIESVGIAEEAVGYGLPAALELICVSPPPGDLPPPGAVSLTLPGAATVEWPAADDDASEEAGVEAEAPETTDQAEVEAPVEEEVAVEAAPVEPEVDVADVDAAAVLQASGEFGVGELWFPLTLTIEVRPEEPARVTLRGGGALLCGLFDAQLHVDGVPLRLDPEVDLDAAIDVRTWPPDEEGEAAGEGREEALRPIEVEIGLTLPQEVLVELLDAGELAVTIGEEVALSIAPAESEAARQLRDHLAGPPPDAEPELPEDLMNRLDLLGQAPTPPAAEAPAAGAGR